jgi:hypothetical protein
MVVESAPTVDNVAVILSDGEYTVRHRTHPAPRDADGTPVLSAPGAPQGPWPGAAREVTADSWSLRLDPRMWPLREGDLVIGVKGTFVVQGRPNLFVNNAAADVDYIAATATRSPEETV